MQGGAGGQGRAGGRGVGGGPQQSSAQQRSKHRYRQRAQQGCLSPSPSLAARQTQPTSSSTRCSSRASASAANLAAFSASSASVVAAASCEFSWGVHARLAGGRGAGAAPQSRRGWKMGEALHRAGSTRAACQECTHLAHRLGQALLRLERALDESLLPLHRLGRLPLQLDLRARTEGVERAWARCWRLPDAAAGAAPSTAAAARMQQPPIELCERCHVLRTWRCAADAAVMASLRSLSLSACSLATASLTEPSCACSSLTLPRSAGGSRGVGAGQDGRR